MSISDDWLGWGAAAVSVAAAVIFLRVRQIRAPTPGATDPLNSPDLLAASDRSDASIRALGINPTIKRGPPR